MNGEQKEKKKIFTFKNIFEFVFIALMLLIVGLIVARYISFSEKPFASQIIWSDDAKAEYDKAPDNFVIYDIPSVAITQGMDESLTGEKNSPIDNYTVSNMIFFDATLEFQLTVKYPVRDLEDKNVTRPYDFVLEDDMGGRYEPVDVSEKIITGYVYCRVTYENVDIFKTDSLAMIFVKDGKEEKARLIYNTLDRFDSERNVNVYGIAYSDIQRKYSLRIRLDSEKYNEPEILVRADGTVIKPNIKERSIYGTKLQYFLEFEEVLLDNYENIVLSVDGSEVLIYDRNTDRRVLEEFSTEGLELASYYEVPSNVLITPVVGSKDYKYE